MKEMTTVLHVAVTLHTLALTVLARARTKLTATPERGSETMDKVIWGAAVVAIAAVAIAAVRAFVTREVANIK